LLANLALLLSCDNIPGQYLIRYFFLAILLIAIFFLTAIPLFKIHIAKVLLSIFG
jgi:hypothetical protein